jgi:hypothetical protein
MTLSAQVNSTIFRLSPATKVANEGITWTFGDGFVLTNANGKNYGEFAAGAYKNDGDSVSEATLKLSRQVPFKITIPDGKVVVKVDLIGFSNSPEAKNWDFLSYIDNGGEEFMIYKETAVAYSTLNNDTIINKCKYPLSPLAKDFGVFASFVDGEGWYSELNFMIDGNNQAGIIVCMYVVAEQDMANYTLENDATITDIQTVVADKSDDGPMYNLLGQRVDEGYKGLVIKNGKKYILK